VTGNEDVFLQSGDIVKGGKQDRTFQYDAVIGPNSGRVPLASFCVEQGRWAKREGDSAGFFSSSSSNVSTSENRYAASSSGESNQSEVWRNVARTQDRLSKKLGVSVKAEASKSSLQLTLESPVVRDAVAPYLTALGPILESHDDVIGFVAVVNGRIVVADVYASRALFRKLWPKLLDGSAVEAFIEAEPDSTFSPIQADAVQAFLTQAEGAALHSEALTERTYVQVRRTDRVLMVESCDRSRSNLVLHRSFLTR
jgi:ARG and Rhodanese-Phosphatase-superfamily-associated Protein domain